MKNIKLKHHNTLCYDIEIARVEIQKEQVSITKKNEILPNSLPAFVVFERLPLCKWKIHEQYIR